MKRLTDNLGLAKLEAIFFVEIPSTFLGILRILTCLVAIAMTITIFPDAVNIYGSKSYFNHEILFLFDPPYYPKLSWLTDLLQSIGGVNEVLAIKMVLVLYIIALVLLLLGIYTRLTALVSLFLCCVFTSSGEPFIYGVDYFILACLFYCFVFPSGGALTLNHFLKDLPVKKAPIAYLYLLQAHVGMVYLFNGLAKSLGDTWWSGEAIWRATMLLDTRHFDLSFMADYPFIFKYSSWIVLSCELFYPILMSFKPTQLFTLIVILGMHLFIGVFMGLYFFAAIMITLNVAAFGHILYRYYVAHA